MKLMKTLFMACLGAALCATTSAGAHGSYVLGVVPQFTAPQIYKEWQPLIRRLSADTGAEYTLKTYDSIPQFEGAFLRGEIDLAYMNPYHVVMASRGQGYIPLVRDAKPLKGILLVRKDGARSLDDLEGGTLGFPAPNAFGAALYMRALLTEEHKLKFQARWLRTHSNVFRHVIAGDVVAGGSVRAAFDSEPANVRDQLRILFETPGTAPHALAAHPRLPAELRRKVVDAMLGLSGSPEGQELLKSVRMPGIMRADYARDYLPLEKIKLDKYVLTEHE